MNHEPLPSLTSWALISVSKKTGVDKVALALAEHGIGILSTGGTADYIREKTKVPVYDVSKYTGFPEMMDGRVKTLHPKVHGALLYRRDLVKHIEAAEENGMLSINFLIVNLYPFVETIAKPNVTIDEAIEQIDIGGPGMLRSAGKNYKSVTPVVDPADYKELIQELKRGEGVTTPEFRLRMATKVYECTSEYDGQIAAYLKRNGGGDDGSPRLPL